MFTVRFHLGAGEHFKHWQVRHNGEVHYFDPAKYSLVLVGCTLVNKRGTAERVFASQLRDVCGFIECDAYEAVSVMQPPNNHEVMYDPKIAPYWRRFDGDGSYDGSSYERLVTNGRKVYIP